MSARVFVIFTIGRATSLTVSLLRQIIFGLKASIFRTFYHAARAPNFENGYVKALLEVCHSDYVFKLGVSYLHGVVLCRTELLNEHARLKLDW